MNNIIRRFNIIDILIVSVLALGVLALVFRLVMGSTDDNEVFEFTYICNEAPIELLNEIKTDEICIDADSGAQLGLILSAATEPLNEVMGRGVIVTKTNGKQTEHGIEVDNSIYIKGKKINLIIGDSIFEVYLSDITAEA